MSPRLGQRTCRSGVLLRLLSWRESRETHGSLPRRHAHSLLRRIERPRPKLPDRARLARAPAPRSIVAGPRTRWRKLPSRPRRRLACRARALPRCRASREPGIDLRYPTRPRPWDSPPRGSPGHARQPWPGPRPRATRPRPTRQALTTPHPQDASSGGQSTGTPPQRTLHQDRRARHRRLMSGRSSRSSTSPLAASRCAPTRGPHRRRRSRGRGPHRPCP